jgi:hypothetical protein
MMNSNLFVPAAGEGEVDSQRTASEARHIASEKKENRSIMTIKKAEEKWLKVKMEEGLHGQLA